MNTFKTFSLETQNILNAFLHIKVDNTRVCVHMHSIQQLQYLSLSDIYSLLFNLCSRLATEDCIHSHWHSTVWPEHQVKLVSTMFTKAGGKHWSAMLWCLCNRSCHVINVCYVGFLFSKENGKTHEWSSIHADNFAESFHYSLQLGVRLFGSYTWQCTGRCSVVFNSTIYTFTSQNFTAVMFICFWKAFRWSMKYCWCSFSLHRLWFFTMDLTM